MRTTHNIDATDKPLGRLAVEVAGLLRGKEKPSFAPYKDEGGIVIVENIDKMKITGKKLKQKIYYRHSGKPGHLKQRTMEQLIAQKGRGEVLKRAVSGMLPKNKLRAKMIKRLRIK